MSTRRAPAVRAVKRAADSDLAGTDAELAERLWADGWRPVEARSVVPGHLVWLYSADLMGDGVAGTGRAATVYRVHDDGYGTTVHHSDGATEADELSEVWTREAG